MTGISSSSDASSSTSSWMGRASEQSRSNGTLVAVLCEASSTPLASIRWTRHMAASNHNSVPTVSSNRAELMLPVSPR